MEIKDFKNDFTLVALWDAELCRQEELKRQKRIEWAFNKGWLKIQRGLTKKELNKLLKKTQENINDYLERNRDPAINEFTKSYNDAWREDWMLKKKKIQDQIKYHTEFDTNNKYTQSVEKAKAYPIENMVEFNSYGFSKCLWHSERTASMKLYPKNRVNCFGGCGNFDSIDVYMKINNVNFNQAIKALS